MKFSKIAATLSGIMLGGMLLTSTAVAKGRLVVYCSTTNEMCEAVTKAFGEKYNVNTAFIRNSSGSILAKVESEKNNPQADVWYGGTFDPQAQAADMGLLHPYRSKYIDEIEPAFQNPAKTKEHYVSAIYLGVLGFGINTDRLQKLGITEEPKCWKDLTDPKFKGEVQISDPQSAGTAYTALATFVQLWGEEKAFEFLKQLHPNVSQYTKSGITPIQNNARGETLIGISFLQGYVIPLKQGAPVKMVVPCEGTGYELGGLSIIKGARNLENAKLYVDYVLSKEGQEITWRKSDSYQTLTNTKAEQSPYALDPKKFNLINYDFEKYGANAERKHLIERWVKEIKLSE